MRLIIAQRDLEQMVERASRGYPYEVCGLVGGHASGEILTADAITAVRNVSSTPRTGYEMERRAMVEAILAFQRAGREVVAIYHSHPGAAPVPSAVDVAQASWPDVVWIIASVSTDRRTEVGAWTIRYGKVTPAALEVSGR